MIKILLNQAEFNECVKIESAYLPYINWLSKNVTVQNVQKAIV
jgi:hypothetical protein